jgi:hypothetical protein
MEAFASLGMAMFQGQGKATGHLAWARGLCRLRVGRTMLTLVVCLATMATSNANAADNRVFEMVSPPFKSSGEVAVPGRPAGGLVSLSVEPLQSSPSGEAITYASFTAFANPESAPGASQYLSQRSDSGWSTENLSPADQEGYLRDPLVGFSPDLSFATVDVLEPQPDPNAPPGVENLYRRDNSAGFLTLLTTGIPQLTIPKSNYCVAYGGASNGFSHVIFMAKGSLTSDAPVAEGNSLYEWSASEGLHLVSVLPNGAPAQPKNTTGFGKGSVVGCTMSTAHVARAISTDGSRIFWTFKASFVGGSNPLFARLNGAETIQLDAPQGGPGPGGQGEFWTASVDGSKVFFADRNRLTADATGFRDLYLYDLETKALTDLTVSSPSGDLQGVIGASEDGSYVYFVTKGVLGAGAIAGQPNLYALHLGESVRFIATLAGEGTDDPRNWDNRPNEQSARVSPDGRHLAFHSVRSLTGYDNTDQATGEPDSEAYLYNFENGTLTCVSCNPSGSRPVGRTTLPTWTTPYEQPRYLSDDGSRFFFQSDSPLVPRDTNGKQDVYEWEMPGRGSCSETSPSFSGQDNGCVDLVSTGASSDQSYLLDASSSGRDVFISSRQQLLPRDDDERYDVYDAREGGGFPEPPPPPPPCASEACRAFPVNSGVASPGSATFTGKGNVNAARPKPRCPKGRHRVRRRGKLHCARGHRRAHRGRRAER